MRREGSAGASDSSESVVPGISIGTLLAEKYRIDKVLGRGGMGVVVAAHHLHLEERVAIKFLLPEIARDRDLVSRFLREARAAIRITTTTADPFAEFLLDLVAYTANEITVCLANVSVTEN